MSGADIGKILEERGKTHGVFMEQATLVQALEGECIMHREGAGYRKLAKDQREALHMILHKISRILSGDPNCEDSWRDISGYSTLVADRLLPKPSVLSPNHGFKLIHDLHAPRFKFKTQGKRKSTFVRLDPTNPAYNKAPIGGQIIFMNDVLTNKAHKKIVKKVKRATR